MTNLERHKNMTADELSELHYFECPHGFQPAGFGFAAYETCGTKDYKKCEACKKAWLEADSGFNMTNLERHKNMTADELSKAHYFGCPHGFKPAGFGFAAYETCGAKDCKKCEACKKAWLEGECKI